MEQRPLPQLARGARDRLSRIADDALAAAGVLGTLPTPLEAILPIAGITERIELERLPVPAPPALRPVLGALWFEERTMFVDESQPLARRRFTEAHEAMHALCPWHRHVLRLDTADELFKETRVRIEAEANFGASALIFQGGAFRRRAGGEPCTMAVAEELADVHGASLQAALHHHVELHRDAVALIVTGRFPRRDGSLPVWSVTQSAAFRRRHRRVCDLVRRDGVAAGSVLRDVIEAARIGEHPSCSLGRQGGLRVEARYNRHSFLVLVRPSGRRRAGSPRASSR